MSNKLVIDVRQWGRGNPSNTLLRSRDIPIKKCCLGFYGEECEVDACALDGISMPREEVETWPRWLFIDQAWEVPADIVPNLADREKLKRMAIPSFLTETSAADILAGINDCRHWNQSMFYLAARQWQRPYWYVRVVADIAQARLLRNQKAVEKMYEGRP